MASDLTANDIAEIARQADVRSKPLRENFANIKNKINELNSDIGNIGVAASGAEITAARPNHLSLLTRIDSINNGQFPYIKVGGLVAERATPGMTVQVSALQANVNGIDVRLGFGTWTRSGATITVTSENHPLSNTDTIDIEVTSDATPVPLGEEVVSNVSGDDFDFTGVASGGTSGTLEFAIISGTVTAPTTNPRFDVVVVNTDNTLSIVTGAESATPVIPTVATTQKGLAILVLDDSPATTSLNDGVEIQEARSTGCAYIDNGIIKGSFTIQGAVDALSATTGGTITIFPGTYYEEVDLIAQSNVTLNFDAGAVILRKDASSRCIKSINTGGNEETNIVINGGNFQGNSQIGAIELLRFEFTDKIIINDSVTDGNASSTADSKDAKFENCDNVNLKLSDYSNVGGETVTNFNFDAFLRATYGSATAESTIYDALEVVYGKIDTERMSNTFFVNSSGDARIYHKVEHITGSPDLFRFTGSAFNLSGADIRLLAATTTQDVREADATTISITQLAVSTN